MTDKDRYLNDDASLEPCAQCGGHVVMYDDWEHGFHAVHCPECGCAYVFPEEYADRDAVILRYNFENGGKE